MEFQIYDYIEDHEVLEESDDESDNGENTLPKFIIHVFGRTQDDKSVYCKLTDYTPHFYIKLPSKWAQAESKMKIKEMFKWFKSYDNKKVWKKFREGLLSMDMVTRKEAIGFTNDKDFSFARLVFSNSFAMKKFRYMLENNKLNIPRVTTREKQFECYEANLPPMLRCFHIKKISGCSWVRVEKYEQVEEDGDKNSYCDIELTVSWTDIQPIEKEFNAPLRIASFDIECISGDGQFPMARRKSDKVIQIGTTCTKLGESIPYRQHIVCLDATDPVDNVITEWYDNERDLILAWKKEIIRSDCDIMTGYNIFFFDEKYVYDRCEHHLGIKHEMALMSKLRNYECNFRDFKLASSALGENQLRYWDTPGRIHVDLMKDVQKTFNLASYKLDNVASHFIRGKILKIDLLEILDNKNVYLLHCENVNDIMVQDYMHIEHVKSFVSDFIGRKYLIQEIDRENKTLKIITEQLVEQVDEGSLFWSQAKDDVGPQDIFRLQRGNSADRSIVAKYCVKDCRLVNLLVNKLEVITKNMEMANVCYVPLSYLFVRGQGVKLFSLCLKVYREQGYLFPVLKKPESTNDGYEGAIVFDPVPNVDYEAICTKDYAALYPSAIIQKNMSHETMIMSSDYDELPGVTYYNSNYKQSDGTVKYCRFAKKSDKLGVVPLILDTLLKGRRLIKKQMKNESNPFKYKILDAKQLALKVTANSLYGQLGAPTSPVFMKAIAACTTSTGREMLIFAKKYDEEVLPGFLNGLKYAYKKNDMVMVNKILDMELKDRNNEKFIERIKTYITDKLDGYIYQPVIRYGDTDSVFTCFRFKEGCIKVKKNEGLDIWKSIISFSKDLLLFFLPEEHHDLWNQLHDKYYGDDTITKLSLPSPPEILPVPEHWNVLLPIEERMKQFLKEYMEESYLPWLWTLQELYATYKEKFNNKRFEEIIEAKLYKFGEHQIEKMRLSTIDLTVDDELDNTLDKKKEILNLRKVFQDKIEQYVMVDLNNIVIEPYWSIKNTKKIMIKLWKNGKPITDNRTVDLTIEMGVISGETVKKRLPFPHDLEYEKTYWPFLILTKKRYVGNKYEFDTNKFKQDFMGIVLKRRDNAPIVKEVCNGIIDSLINYKDPKRAKKFTKQCLKDMFKNKYDVNYFVTSKTLKLKESYKDWTRIAHMILADRISIRDPGNVPQSGDRMSFAVIKIPNKTKDTLQGDIIETPEYIKEKNLELDYLFYMTNQIMKPALQFLELVFADAESIFNPYIFKDKVDELLADKRILLKYIASHQKEEFDESSVEDVDFSDMKMQELTDLTESLKKEVRRLKCDQRRIIKAIDVLGKDGAEKALVKPKVVKEKVVKEKVVKEKVVKEKVVKEKVVKEKVVKEKVVKKKGDKEPVISAIDV